MEQNKPQTPPPPPPSQPNQSQPKFKYKEKPTWMKLAIAAACFVPTILFFAAVGTCSEKSDKATDTVAVDSVEEAPKIKIDSAEVARLAPLFKANKDEFKGRTWIYPNDAPKYSTINTCYAYFEQVDSVPTNMRFVIQYTGDDWLFIKKYTFLIDGKPLEMIPDKMQRDNDHRVWEWSDNSVADNAGALGVLLRMLHAKEVKLRYEGDKYYYDRTLSKKEVGSIVNTFRYYRALGGEF